MNDWLPQSLDSLRHYARKTFLSDLIAGVTVGAREQPAQLMRQAEFHEHVGDRNVCANIREALRRAEEIAAEQGILAKSGA